MSPGGKVICGGGSLVLTRGFYLPSVATVLLVILFVAMLFGTRLLQRSQPDEIAYSERYYELVNQKTLNDAEKAELELETCRFKRRRLVFLQSKPLASYDQESADYLRACESILPLKKSDR